MRCFPVVLALLGFAMAAPRSAMAGERTIPELEAELEARLAERFQRAVVLAQICEASGDRQGAATHYEFARRIDGTDIYVLSQLAVLYRVQRDDARLLSIYETLSRTQPASIAWLRELGSCHFRLGHGEEAEAAWRRILDVYPNRAGALRYLAPIYVQHGLYDKAAVFYQEALALSPQDVDIRVRLAEALHAGGDSLAALSTIAGMPANASSYHTRLATEVRNKALAALGLSQAGQVVARRVLDDGPCTVGDLAWSLARVFEQGGDLPRAAQLYRRVAEVEPDSARGKEAAEKARQLGEKKP